MGKEPLEEKLKVQEDGWIINRVYQRKGKPGI